MPTKTTRVALPTRLGLLFIALQLVRCGSPTPVIAPHYTPVTIPSRPATPSQVDFERGHKDLLASALTNDHASLTQRYPAPDRVLKLSYDPLEAMDLGRILKEYPLTSTQKASLQDHGFVIVPPPAAKVPEHVYKDVYRAHLPVMITSDSILYSLHRSYDSLLKQLERKVLIPELTTMLTKMHEQLGAMSLQGSIASRHSPSAQDVDVYLAVARSLLVGKTQSTVLTQTDPRLVAAILEDAKAKAPVLLGLFGEEVTADYSQLKPRGHYTDSEELKRYFQSMMWLGRTEMRLVRIDEQGAHYNPQAFAAALMMVELLDTSGAVEHWSRIDQVIERMVGEKDSMDPTGMRSFLEDAPTASLADLQTSHSEEIKNALLAGHYGTQRIMSQILHADPAAPKTQLPRVFQLMGQRFSLDSLVLSRTSYDRLVDPKTSKKIRRMMPSALDVQFALGSNTAAEFLADELETFNYAHRLHELRYVVDSYPEGFWANNLYNAWLDAIRALNPNELRAARPESMRTKAWDQKTLSTQLASWAELRHDTLLYAKQSYSGSIACEYPSAYVEPVPVFYSRMQALANVGLAMTKELGDEGFEVGQANTYFHHLDDTMGKLQTIAHKELSHTPLSGEEKMFLKGTIEVETVGCGSVEYDGWFPRLFYDGADVSNYKPTIADVHTAPTDRNGDPVGWVLHAGTGPVGTMIFTVNHGGISHAFVGPVSSYYSFRTTGFKRLDDNQWLQKLSQPKPPRPAL